MQDGLCYIRYSSDTIYAFPDLSCDEGSVLPEFSSTTRQTYIISNGKYIPTQTRLITNDFNYYSGYITHVSSGMDRYAIDSNFLILPATLIVLAFLSVIYHWFIRLRG